MTSAVRLDIVPRNAATGDDNQSIKNKWRWDWLDRKIGDVKLGTYFEKLKEPGKCYCTLCRVEICYKSGGCRALGDHVSGKLHNDKVQVAKTNFCLPAGFGKAATSKVFPIFSSKKTVEPQPEPLPQPGSETSTPVRPIVPVCDRESHAQAAVLAFTAENSLPLAMVPKLVEFAQHMARDPAALKNMSIEQSSASYKLTYGLAKTFQQQLEEDIAACDYFCLNIDEAMSSNHQKMLSVMISFFNERLQKINIQHLGSVSLVKVNSVSVVAGLEELFAKHSLQWNKCLAILMDSCNVMRGSKAGVEIRIREKHANHLLDIDGDTCHHIHGCAKQFTAPFGRIVEQLFGDIYSDFQYSPAFQQCLSEICFIMGVKYTMPQRFISHRWLSVLDLTDDTLRLFDCFTLLYYEFLPKSDKTTYHSVLIDILTNKEVPAKVRHKLIDLRSDLGKVQMTDLGKKRKQRIIKKLFYGRDDTLLQLKFLASTLPLLKEFVLLFQRHDPLIHILHEEQVSLLKQFLLYFIKADKVKMRSLKQLLSLDVSDRSNWLPQELLFMGKAGAVLRKKDAAVQAAFRATALKAYAAAAKDLQKKLPLENKFLQAAGGLNPQLASTDALRKLLSLPQFLPHILGKPAPGEDLEELYDLEVRKFLGNDNLPALKEGQRIDEWWATIFRTESLPLLTKVVKAVLSVFHGPVVESSFNIMTDIMDERSGRMAVETFNAFQMIKYGMKASGQSALEQFRRQDILRDPVNPVLVQNMSSAHASYHAVLDSRREELERKKQAFQTEELRVTSKRKAIEASRQSAKKARLVHIKKSLKKFL